MQILIDVVGGCNLKCPSCPVGNMKKNEGGVRGGAIKIDFLEKIIDKAIHDIDDIEFVGIYNWTEPLLHPKISVVISTIKSKGLKVHLSSNLNILKDPDSLMKSNPDYFRVSVSGYNQGVYSLTHRGGDIEAVKRNMIQLMESKLKMRAETKMVVLFHKYMSNIQDEREMKKFSESLGYEFESVWAYLMPLEKTLAYLGYGDINSSINADDWSLIDNLALPLAEVSIHARKYFDRPCWLKENQLVLSPEGDVILCCSVYDQETNKVGKFLDLNIDEIRILKNRGVLEKTCNKCMKAGWHVLGMYAMPELDRLAKNNIKAYYK